LGWFRMISPIKKGKPMKDSIQFLMPNVKI
jgi:hypothetical protein